MKNSRIAFKLLERHGKPPVGYTEITCRLFFDLDLDKTRKSWYVAGDHIADVPTHTTYLSVLSRDTVHIGLLMVAINGLDILVGGIHNAFLQAPT